MNLSPLQLDTNCFNNTSHYHPSYYNNNLSTWSPSSSSSSLLCPSTTMNYQTSSVPSALQPIENYCSIETFYPSGSEPIASSSEMSFYSSSSQFSSAPNLPSSHIYSSDDFIIPSSTTMMLPQNRANYTRHQLVMLNEIFKKHKYPNSLQKTLIAKYIGVSRDQIRIWFQNKRRKVQLINKGQAKQTKSDIECEYGEYRRHLPKNFLDDLFQELYKARGAPARLPVKRDNNSKMNNIEQEQEQEQQQPILYYPTTMNSNYYYQTNNLIEHDDSSHEQNDEQYLTNYTHHIYSDRL
ncbi:unnamed protein product [Rotaria sordida]|uniref:Homeobox domain-containing protein n=2 Tax=Rotaria TaxID=231623 RepID=A0A818RDK6_9BILA|nr:unnamed protein product [Rotaria sordida]CAF0781187.1 unnamed protein product [Rotaria sordida]CAF0814720.1 unnamed protein product [Rotaria sordida]CAF3553221.1 unnamed protein product [Rotaria sordida]CAF3651307.1 unnamed protein product [Rotaria sordida]